MREGLCVQCERELFEKPLDPNYRDFRGVGTARVLCYGCGVIKVDADGFCATNCRRKHYQPKESFLTKLRRFFTG